MLNAKAINEHENDNEVENNVTLIFFFFPLVVFSFAMAFVSVGADFILFFLSIFHFAL